MQITKTVTISTLKQKSQTVLDELNNNQIEAMILTQDGLPVAVLLPARGILSEAERLKLVERESESADKILQDLWGNTNKNVHYNAQEIDQNSF